MEATTTTTSSYLLKISLTFLLFISNFKKFSLSSPSPSPSPSVTTTTNTPVESTGGDYKNYLKTACNSTTYPKLCYSSLSSYISTIKTDDRTLCVTALNVSLQVAYNTSSLVSLLSKQKELKKIEAEAIQDCIQEMGDSIDELKQSIEAFGSIKWNSSDVGFQISNIQTWVSAALTDEDTCSDGFDESGVSSWVKKSIKDSILNVARITSNALALVNRLPY